MKEGPAGTLTPDDVGRLVAIVGLTAPARLTSVAHRVQPPQDSPLAQAGGSHNEPVWTALAFEANDGTPLPGAWVHPQETVRLYEPGDLVHGPQPLRGHPVPEATTDALVDFLRRLRVVAQEELTGGEIPTGGGTPFLVYEEHELGEWYDGVITRVQAGWRP